MSVPLINPAIYPFDLYKQAQYTDPVLINAFNLLIPVIPGSDNNPNVAKSLQIQLQELDSPIEYTINKVGVKMGRGIFNYAGAMTWKQELKVTFFETANGFVIDTFQNWRDMEVNYQTGLNGAKLKYATSAILYVIGVDNQIAMQCNMENLWLSNFKAGDKFVQDSSKNDQLKVTGSFVIDYLESPILVDLGAQNA